jgi:predicted ATPase
VEARNVEDPATAAGLLREALALWRGPPLADLAYESFGQPEIARLEESRLAALEQRIESDLALGRHDELVGELEGLTAQHPLRERLRGQLMLALYRSGRQAEALQSYQAARTSLVDELGIEPGRALRELNQAILQQDPGLDLPVREHPVAETSGGTFVGRGRELAELVAGLEDAFAGRGRLFLLSGEPGIGKTRLAEELMEHARARGARVLVGRCWEAGGAPAYWPWVQSLRAYVRESDPAALGTELGTGAADLAQVLPELRERFPDLPPPSPVEPESARFRLFDATAEFLHNAAERRPIVLVLDDLHAADAPSLLLLRFLARQVGSMRLLLLGAYRDVDPVPADSLNAMLAEVAREPAARRLALDGLSESEVAEYLELTASEMSSPQLVASLHGQTVGNPLFVGEIVRLLSVEGELPEPADVPRLTIPQSVRDVIVRRVSHLSTESNRLLVLASVLGREFAPDVLARLGGVSDDELLEWLDEAIAARVVSDVPGSPGRLRFEHVLIRDTLYDELTSARRVRLHELAVEALEQLHDEHPGLHLPELARHSIAAGDPDKGLRYSRQAADRALELLAYEEAARLYRLGLEAIDLREPWDASVRCELLLAMGDALTNAGSTADAKQAFLAAGDVARAARMPESFALAALGYGGRSGWQRAAGDRRLVPLLEDALKELGETAPPLRARLLGRLAGALRDEPSLEPRASISREAVEIARGLGDKDLLAYTLVSHVLATWGPDPGELVPIAEEVSRLAQETGTSDAVLDALTLHSLIAWLTLAEGDAATLDDRFNQVAEELGQPADLWQAAMQDVVWALFRGDFAAAEQLAEEALGRGDARRADADCSYRLAMFVLRREQGRLAEIEELIRDAVDEYPGYRSFRCFIPLLDYELGREQQARRAFDELAEEDFAALPRDSEWLFCLSILAEVAVYLEDRDAAVVLYRLLEPYAEVNVLAAGEVAIGPVERFLGILATTTGRSEEAAGHFQNAIAMTARMDARPWLAHAQHDYARMLLERDKPGDRESARDLLGGCVAAFRELGMDRWAEAAARLELRLNL